MCGAEGEVVRSGTTTFWYSGATSPVPALIERMEATYKRLEVLLGKSGTSLPPVRVFCFDNRAAFDAFHRPFFLTHWAFFKSLDGVYFASRHRLVTVCTDSVPYRVVIPEAMIQWVTAFYLSRLTLQKTPQSWLIDGTSRLAAADADLRSAMHRINRALLARGTTFGTSLFQVKPTDVWRYMQRWDEYGYFERLQQYGAESWSLVEFLAGARAPDERREQFRALLNDPEAKKEHEKAMWRHFGFGFADLVARWRQWANEQCAGRFALPEPRIRQGLLERVIPLIEDRQANGKERLLAIRYVGSAGQVMAAGALIDLLSGDDTVPKEEVVWALEAIAGVSYGDDVERWAAWWQSLPAEITQARRQGDTASLTVTVGAGHAAATAGEVAH